VGVGLISPGPIGVEGFTITTDSPAVAASRATCSARNHVANTDRCAFIARGAILGNTDSCHAAGIYNSSNTCLARCLQDASGPLYVGFVELFGIECAQTVISRDMEQCITAGQRAVERGPVCQVPFYDRQ
jgi:hypothetical protein